MTGVKHRPWLLQSFQRTDRLGPFVKYDSIPSVCVLLICRTREKSQNTTTWLFESFNFFNGTFSWSSCSTAASRRWQQSCTYQWPHDCWSLREWLQLELHPLPSLLPLPPLLPHRLMKYCYSAAPSRCLSDLKYSGNKHTWLKCQVCRLAVIDSWALQSARAAVFPLMTERFSLAHVTTMTPGSEIR